MKRTLSLKRESLAELDTTDLRHVVGGAAPTLPLDACLNDLFETMQATRCFCP